jgi:hypothetical protein
VTAVQFAAARARSRRRVAALLEGAPQAPTALTPAVAAAALAVGGTLLPFWLFAFAQARVTGRARGCVREPRAGHRRRGRLADAR